MSNKSTGRQEGIKSEETDKKADFNPNISITTLKANGLNTPIKRQRLAEWIKKTTQLYFVYKKVISNIMIQRN